MTDTKHKNGKGDSPRNCFSKQFKTNYDEIDWRYKNEYCEECGISLSKTSNVIVNKDGSRKCKICNFN